MKSDYQCRACGSKETSNLGLLPQGTHFAGKVLNRKLPESSLYVCNSCYMLVRHPILARAEYNQLYSMADSTVWCGGEKIKRQDQSIVREIILRKYLVGEKILDIGCYTGDLLASLPNNILKFGIEMSKEAADIACSRGVEVVGNDMYQIHTKQKFNLILAVDVIEHTENPEEFLNNLIPLLEINGEIIVSTGNADNKLWKKLKNKFWYSSFPEHISFIGERWLDGYCDRNNLKVTEKHFFSHMPTNITSSLKAIVKRILLMNFLFSTKYSNTTKDHICFVIKAE